MKNAERWLMIAAVCMLGMTFVFPLWQLDIWAPQYPEGLGMTIWLNKITGSLDQINILNHYIGMKAITPSAIPELVIMPKVVAALMGLGIVAAVINRRWAIGVWIVTMLSGGVVGMYDFYKWGYDYGHNLSPDAPIKMEGMTYQPPLIGHQTILNIDAYSFPDFGGIAVGLSVALAVLAFFWRVIPWKRIFHKISNLKIFRRGQALGLVIFLSSVLSMNACTSKPVPLEVGVDTCETCRMTITDNRFGGETIMDKGKIFKFDSLPCLAKFNSANHAHIKSIFVADFLSPGKLVELKDAYFMRSKKITAPMGDGIVASSDLQGLKAIQSQTSGEQIEWTAVTNSAKF